MPSAPSEPLLIKGALQFLQMAAQPRLGARSWVRLKIPNWCRLAHKNPLPGWRSNQACLGVFASPVPLDCHWLVAVLTVGSPRRFFLAPPRTYVASATMLIETHKSPLSEALSGGTTLGPAWIESQIAVLKSQNVAGYVVKQLRLADDPQFLRSRLGTFEKLFERLGWVSNELNSEAERVAAATTAVMDGLRIRRSGQSYTVGIDFEGYNADQPAKITNMIIDGYIFDQLNAKYQANRRSGDWLQERLQALREQAATAERAAIEFRAKNNMFLRAAAR